MAQHSTPARPVERIIRGDETSDGAGVRLRRMLGGPELEMLDPFLLLDAFRSDDPDDYIAGKPFDEPVARSGPFVMSSREELQQAYEDYRRGAFGRVTAG